MFLGLSVSAAAQDRARIEQSVVRVFVFIDGRVQTSGTGFVIGGNGLVVAAAEIGRWRRAHLRVFSAGQPADSANQGLSARVVEIMHEAHIVLLEVPGLDAPALPLQLLPVANRAEVSVASFPRTREGKWPRQVVTLSPGEILLWGVPDPSRYFSAGQNAFVLFDATPEPGSMGGPLLNACGQVVGISVLAQTEPKYTNYIAASTLLILAAAQAHGIPVAAVTTPCVH